MADFLEKHGIEKPELVESSGGAFEIKLGNRLVFSKLRSGRFPEHREILGLLSASPAD
ncbi:Rdx family protein [bacterium]|nr:Rdx family protein [bacterium]MBU1984316.1 Rdx family protein [bacterium]